MRIIRDILVRTFLILACAACSQVQDVGVATSFLPKEPKELKAPHGCVLQERDKLHLMHQVVDEAVDVINFYTHPCSGGLYLTAPNKAPDKLTVLYEGWWLQGLYRPQWRQTDDGRALEITGSYITGVGPAGSRPFVARIRIVQTDIGWRVFEPEVDVLPPAHPKELPGSGSTLFVVHNAAELTYLNESLEHWDVDFATERLVLMNTDVHSTTDAIVTTDGKSYFLKLWSTANAFHIGTPFTMPGVLWMVVPKDDLSIRGSPYDQVQPQCEHCRAGAVATMQRLVGYVAARQLEPGSF